MSKLKDFHVQQVNNGFVVRIAGEPGRYSGGEEMWISETALGVGSIIAAQTQPLVTVQPRPAETDVG